jgi:hypothetical protein
VEQVRLAACAWITGQWLKLPVKKVLYQRVIDQIEYYQYRNRDARKSHRKKRLRKLRELGINVSQLKSCVLRDY